MYFAKWIVIPGDTDVHLYLKEGEWIQREWYKPTGGFVREIVQYKDYMKSMSEKRVKLFLCSRDIQIGDKFSTDTESDLTCTDILLGVFYDKTTTPWKSFDPQVIFKPIGRISPESSWIKEGMEFDEEEVRFIDEPGEDMDIEYVPLYEFDSYYTGKGYRKPFPDYIVNLRIVIKCPHCGTFT